MMTHPLLLAFWIAALSTGAGRRARFDDDILRLASAMLTEWRPEARA